MRKDTAHLDSASAPRIAFRAGHPTAYIQSSSEKSCGILDVNAEILPFHVPSSQCGMDVTCKLLRRLFERGDHARDARLHLAYGRGGEIHPPGDLRAVVAGREELAVDPPRLLGYRRPPKAANYTFDPFFPLHTEEGRR